MVHLQALFLDLDSTLLDNSGVQDSIVRTCAKIAAIQPALDAARLVAANNEVWEAYWPEVEDEWTLGALDGASVNLEAWRRTLSASGWDDESMVRYASQTHRQHEGEALRLFDDALDLFASMKRAHIPLALITNGASDTQRDKLRTLGIESWFDAIVVSGELGVAKPDPSVFDLALDQLEVDREHVWHVGDNLMTDVAGAKAARVTAVWLNRGGLRRGEDDPEPDIEIRSLSNLITLLVL